jgi:hypothetical protein
LRAPAREEVAPDELEAYDSVVERLTRMHPDGQMLVGYFGALLHSPEFAAALSRWGTLIRSRGDRLDSYSHADREFVDVILSFESGYNAFLRTHLPDAIAVGVRLEAIEALRDGREQDLTDDERQLLDYVRRVITGTMTESAFTGMSERLGLRGAIEFTAFTANLYASLLVHKSVGVPQVSAADLDAMLRSLRDGTLEVPDPRARVR